VTRLELAAGLGVAVLFAAALGWMLHALWIRMSWRSDAEAGEAAELAARLADVEEAQDAEREAWRRREAELLARLEEMETALTRDVAERTAELEAAMDTIGHLRRELEEARRRAG
jgi:hypothetical protein